MSDPRDELRRLIDSAEPVTAAEVRARAGAGQDDTDGLVAQDETRVRRPLLLAAAAAVLVVLVAGLLAWDQSDDARVTTGPTTSTSLGPSPTVLAPIGDDPLVSCDPFDANAWFSLSVWSEPPGAENDPDPAAVAFRAYLDLRQKAVDEGLVPDSPMFPAELPETWRRLSETDDLVVFGAGELDPTELPAEPGPLLTFARAERVDGVWRAFESGAGTCNRLTVHPGDGNSIANWWVPEELRPVDPAATELRIRVSDFPCSRPFGPQQVLGPDVVETSTSVTIRLALALPPVDIEDCMSPVDALPEQSWVDLTVRLRSPLGDRQVLDATQHPPTAVDLQPPPPEQPAPERPRAELPGGTIEQEVEIWVNAEAPCDRDVPGTCAFSTGEGVITVTAGEESASVASNEWGQATLVVPAGLAEVRVDGEDLACAPTRFDAPFPSLLPITCTRLDLPTAVVSGRISATAQGPLTLGLSRASTDSFGRSLRVAVEPDGTFEAVVEPGTWSFSLMDAEDKQTCTVGPVRTIEVLEGVDQTLDLSCA
jgi:hypothetical protein